MTEPQTLDEIMDAEVPDSTEAEVVVESSEPTPYVSKETPETATKEVEVESYTRIDPKTLTPELQAMHKSLLSDYTKKTQGIAEQRKEFEKNQAEYEQLKSMRPQTPVKPQEPTNQALPEGVSKDMTVDEYTAYMLAQVEDKINAQQQQLLEKQEQKYLDNAVKEFEAADERLNSESPAYDTYMRTIVGEALDEELHKYNEEHGTAIGFDYQERTKDLVEQYENYTNEKAKAISSQKTQEAFKGAKRTAPMGVRGTQAPTKPTGKMSLDDAIDAAFNK